jgi:thiamine-monophosphate kinase
MSETLGDIGERAAIARLCTHIGNARGLKVGPGDDCAVVTAGPGATHDWVLTSDPVIEGVHFTPGAERQAVGHKAIGRVLSDIAAMGAEPVCALVDLAAPANTPLTDLDALYTGAAALAETHDCAIAGGDVAEAKVLALHVFGLGRVPAGQAVLRSGARPGDAIYVTGALGGSLAGRHLTFEPRVREGQWLRNWATAMIDVSDGLASDLRRIGESSGAGIVLDLERLPLSAALPPDIPDDERYRRALTDGEDYELLFAVPAQKTQDFDAAWRAAFALPAACVGRLTPETEQAVCIGPGDERGDLPERGFLHFGV